MTPANEQRIFMYIGYIDDSGSSGTNLKDEKVPFQVIGGPVIKDSLYSAIEMSLSVEIAYLVPEEQLDSFEFHACDLFHAQGPFDQLGQGPCWELIKQALLRIENFKIPVIYGAVNKAKLRSQIYRTANPVDMAFELYLASLREWFDEQVPHQKEHPTGLLICDDVRIHKTDDSKKGDIDRKSDARNAIKRAFQRNRVKPRPLVRREVKEDCVETLVQWNSAGIAKYLFDDIYFGDSKTSIGIQLADICVYIIARHLAGKPDPQGFYETLKNQIVHPQVL